MAKNAILVGDLLTLAKANNVVTINQGGADNIYLKELLQGKTDSQQKSFRRARRSEGKQIVALYKALCIKGMSDSKEMKDFIRNYYNAAKAVYVNPANIFAGNVQGVDEKYYTLFQSEVAKYMKSIEK